MSLRLPPTIIVAALCCCLAFSGCSGGDSGDSSTATASKPASKNAKSADTASESSNTADNPSASSETAAKVEPSGTGTLKGVVRFDGAAPKLDLLVSSGSKVKDAETCSTHDLPDESLLIGSENGVANVFVYLRRAPKGYTGEAPTEPVVLDQKGCHFFPHTAFVRTGQTLLIKSDDPIQHNVHTFPGANTGINQLVSPNDRDGISLTYTKSELSPVSVKCDIHAWMQSWHLVLDHPFVAITDADGNFEIKDLPAGKHKFRVWHERAETLEKSLAVEIKADETNSVELSFGADKFAHQPVAGNTQIVITRK